MVQYNPLQHLPSALELPDSDDTPVDNELQILIPVLLRAILVLLWANRTDWFSGINMGVYYEPNKSAIVPDGFLSLGVERFRGDGNLRLSYVLWEENNVIPQWVLEVVSKTPGGEYDDKMTKYAQIGILYYVIYNPDYWKRDKHDPFEVYRLVSGTYVRQLSQPVVWMPEIDLGIGCELGSHEGYIREWLYWYDRLGNRYPAPANVIEQERQRTSQAEQRAEQERQRASQVGPQLEQERQLREELLAKLKQRGIDLKDL